MKHPFPARVLLQAAILLLILHAAGAAYSVLTHEQVIDLLWEDRLQPMLKARFPGLSDDQLKEAHAYAYGGSLMGYYPFGNKYFSDLTHYVRTGDFVLALIHESQNVDEYAFALGALAHYAADNDGHPMVNHVVAMEFPSLRKKYGDIVTYADSPKAHIRAEFGFDMTEVAKNHYTSDRFHDFVGFEISTDLLERVFPEVYGMDFGDVIRNEDIAIGTFRRSVSIVIPEMTRVALLNRQKEIVADTRSAAHRKYLYYLSRTDYERQWGREYRHPGVGARFLALVLKILPKRGPFSALNFKIPSPQAEDLFVKSIDKTVESYKAMLQDSQQGRLDLANKDCDTGRETSPAEYPLADKTYARLLNDLADNRFDKASPDLRANILDFYSNPGAPQVTKKKRKEWQKVQKNLHALQQTLRSGSSS